MSSAFSTSYFPSISYLIELNKADNPVLDLGEHYIRQTYRTRASIRTANGLQNLSIPVIRPLGNKTPTGLVEISNVENWRRDHIRALKTAYSSAPYFDDYFPEIVQLIENKETLLHKYNAFILLEVSSWLDLNLEFIASEVFIEGALTDYRNFNFPNKPYKYQQVCFDKNDFIPNLSILDGLFCLGPMIRNLINDPSKK